MATNIYVPPVSFEAGGIQDINNVVPKVKVPAAGPNKLAVPTPVNTYHIKRNTIYANANAKLNHPTDLGDIVLGNPLTGTRQLQQILKDNDFENLIYVPLLNRIVGTYLTVKERVFEPMIQGDTKTLTVNFLETMGNTADTLSNVVKSLIPVAGGGTLDDLQASLGLLEGEYRKQYKWNTGNVLVDFVGEVLSDPVNWIQLTLKAPVKAVSKQVVEQLTDTYAKLWGREVVDKLPQRVIDEYVQKYGTKALLYENIEKLTAQLRAELDLAIIDDLSKAQLSNLADAKVLNKAIRNYRRALALEIKPDDIMTNLEVIKNADAWKSYIAIRGSLDYANTIDTIFLKAGIALGTGGISVAFEYGLIPLYKAIHNQAVKSLKQIDVQTLLNNPSGTLTKLDKVYYRKLKAAHSDVHNILSRVLKKYDVDTRTLLNKWREYYAKLPVSIASKREVANGLFLKYLTSKIPQLQRILEDTNPDFVLFTDELLGNVTVNMAQTYVSDIIMQANDIAKIVEETLELNKKIANTEAKLLFNEEDIISTIQDRLGKLIKEAPVSDATTKAFNNYQVVAAQAAKHLIDDDLRAQLVTRYQQLLKSQFKDVVNHLNVLKNNGQIKLYNAYVNSLTNIGITKQTIEPLIQLLAEGSASNFSDPAIVTRIIELLESNKTGIYTTNKAIRKNLNYLKNQTTVKELMSDLKQNGQYQIITSTTQNTQAMLDKWYEKSEAYITKAESLKQDVKRINEALDKLDVLINTNVIDLDFIDNLCDTYAGSNILESDLSLTNLLAKLREKLAIKLDETSFSDVVKDAEFLKRHIRRLQDTLTRMPKDVSTGVDGFVIADSIKQLKTFESIIDEILDKKVITTFKELAAIEDEALYTFKISSSKAFEMIYSAVLSTANLDIKGNLVSDLLKSDNTLRKRYNNIIGTLLKSNDPTLMQAARNINEFIGLLDSSNAIMGAMGEARNLFPALRLSKKIQDSAAALFYDIIYKYKDLALIGLRDSDIDILTDMFVEKFDRMWNVVLKEKYLKLGIEYFPEIVNEEFRSEVRQLFDRFITNKRTLFEFTGTAGTLGASLAYVPQVFKTTFDDHNVLDLTNAIGDYFGDVVLAMQDNKIPMDVGTETLNLITNITGHHKLDDITEIKEARNAILRTIQDGKVVNMQLDPSNSNLLELVDTENSIAYAISDSYKAIRDMNLSFKEYGYTTRAALVDEMTKGYKEILELELGREIAEQNISVSIESWININGVLGVKKAYDHGFAITHKILPNEFKNLNSAAYRIFYDNFTTALAEVQSYAVINKNYIHCIRQILNTLNEDPDFIFHTVPDYFDTLSDEDIRTFALLLNSPKYYGKTHSEFKEMLNDLVSKQPDLAQRAEYYVSIEQRYKDLELIQSDFMSPSTAYDEVYNRVVDPDFKAVLYCTEQDLLKPLKDPTSMTRHATDVTRYIQQDVKQLRNTMLPLDNTLKQKVTKYTSNKKALEMLHRLGMPEDATVGNSVLQRFLKQERDEYLLESISRWNAKQLRSAIDDNTDGIMIILDKEGTFLKTILTENNATLPTALGELELDSLKDAGLRIWRVEDDLYFIRRTSLNAPYHAYDYIEPMYTIPKLQRIATDSLKANRNYIDWSTITLPDEIFTGDMIDKEVYEAIISDPRFKDMLGTVEEQKLYRKLDKFGNGAFYTSDTPKPNMFIVGDNNAFNEVTRRVSSHLQDANILGASKSPRLYNSIAKGHVSAIKRVNNENKYLTLFLNDDYFLGNNAFTDIFKNMSDTDIKEVFHRNNWEAVIIRESKGRPAAYKIYVETRAQLNEAIKAGAICVPHEIYRNMVLTLNKHKLDSKILNFYKQSLVSLYKTIYLTSPGFLLRNGIDSLINKNAGATDGISSIIENFGYEAKAAKLLKEHNDIQNKILALAQKNNYPTINRYYTQQILKTLSKEQQQRYIITDLFINSPASGSLSRSLEAALLDYNTRNLDAYLENHFLFQKVWDEAINSEPYIKQIRSVNDWIEQTARYSLFLNIVENGGDYTEAVRKVIGTHFDYDLFKTETGWLEDIFWFSTFPINNYLYYINEGLTKNPDLIKAQLDLMQASWNTGDYTWDDIKKSGYLTYNAAAGNIRVKIGDKNFVIKTGSSLFDFFNLIFNPVDAVKDRLNPFLSVLFGFDDPKQLSPFTTWGSKYKQIKEGRSYVPSVYAELLQYQPTARKHQVYSKIYNSSSWRPKARRPRKSYNAQVYTKRISQKYPYHRSLMSMIKQYHNRVEPMGAEDSRRYQTAIRRWKNTRFRKTTRPIKYNYGQLQA